MFEASVFLTFLSTYLTASTIWWKQLSIVFDDLVSLGKLEQIFDPFVMILRWQKIFDFSLDFLPRIFVLTSWKKWRPALLGKLFLSRQMMLETSRTNGSSYLMLTKRAPRRPAKEYFFVKLTFAELSFCDGPGEEEIFLDVEYNS